jgi:hypothetical protein
MALLFFKRVLRKVMLKAGGFGFSMTDIKQGTIQIYIKQGGNSVGKGRRRME